ncbi:MULTISPECIES: MFS transporter [Bacillus]|uniref:MFS transporter n=1 Tax=Bacillus halotolerans TaxID=260554 RepID=A0A9Q6F2E1_9BACI|nr:MULTISPECIES: MFS transporter [Bacillus]MCY8474549.1 MFS transporter [Bacillus halotolerans]MEC3640684.1 MFS transporter [Bacillus halotolerans]MEC3757622.1 MFS transporter [Bacillus halotolerans]PAY11253.1 MFS transporter [Bacillus sp. 7705b]PLS08072.1 MFS transporter [Bacillus halotolerans]
MGQSLFWRNKGLMTLLASQTISSLGDWLHILAVLTLAAFQLDASSLDMSFLMMSFALPVIVLGPVSGVLADRFDRKMIMFLSEIGRTLTVISCVYVSELWQLYVLLSLQSCFSSLFSPSKNGKLKELTSEAFLQQAVSISSIIDNTAKIFGPALGGIMVAAVSIHSVFFINAGAFLLSAVILFLLPRDAFQQTPNTPQDKTSALASIKEGFLFMKQTPLLLTGLFTACFVLFILQIGDSQAIILIRSFPGAPPELAGWCMAVSGAGMLLTASIVGKRRISSYLLYFTLGACLLGIATGCVPFLGGLGIVGTALFIFAFFIMGAAFGLVHIPFQILVQTSVPVDYSGRVFGAIQSMTTLASILGMAGGGVLAELIGVSLAFLICGCLLIAAGLTTLIGKKMAESRRYFVTESNKGAQR